MIDFFVHMTPVGKARARICRDGHAYTPTPTVDAEETIRQAYFVYRRDHEGIPFRTPLRIRIIVSILRPKTVHRLRPTVKPDADNYLKLCCDALNHVAYEDDCWIVQAHVYKGYVDDPQREGIRIYLEEVK